MNPRRRTGKRAAGIGLILVALAGVPALASLTLNKPKPTVYALSVNVPDGVFSVSNLKPGDYLVRCVRVRNEGKTVARLTGSLRVTGSLAPSLFARVDTGRGLGNAGPSCAGFVADGGHAFGTGLGVPVSSLVSQVDNAWPSHVARSYRIILYLNPNAGNAVERTTASVRMLWQAAAPVVPKPRARYQVNARTGVITVRFTFPAAGALKIKASMLRTKLYGRARASSTKLVTKTLRVKPTASARKALPKARAKHEAFKVTLSLVYRPKGGSPITLKKTLTVVRAGPRR